MEPKDKMHLDPQEEVKNSESKTESTELNVPEKTVDHESTVEDEKTTKDDIVTVDSDVVAGEPAINESEEFVENTVGNVIVSESDTEKKELVVEPEVESVNEEVKKEKTDGAEVDDTVNVVVEDEAVVSEDDTVVLEDVKEEKTAEVEVDDTVNVVVAEEEVVSEDDTVVLEGVKDEKTDEKNKEKSNEAKTKEPELDYATLSEVELINEFSNLVEKQDFMAIHRKVDSIKLNFYKKHKAKIQVQKKEFIEGGGFEEEFKAEADPYEQDLKNLMSQYRYKKNQHNKLLDSEKEENLKEKYEIIDIIKNLVNRKESINKTFQDFKELQIKWREIGLVPQASMKDLWENYHHHVENFYDYIKINKELRDLDLKKNQEEKIGLCEKAEELLIEPSVIKAFNSLQKLHDNWREIGPVPRENKDELWERFKDATTKINKKHQDFFEGRKKAQKKNLEAKTLLCEKVEEIIALDILNYKDWEDKSKEIIELQKYWRTIGFAPKKENNSIYERFRSTCDSFFDKKREFYTKHKEVQANNLQIKIDLCVQAEALKESEDWKKTTDEYISIQKKWKEIGPVPRKHSDIVWKRFRAACDHFFKRKSDFFSTIDETQVGNLKLKNDLIIGVLNFELTGNDSADLEKIRDLQRKWNEIGHVPFADKNDVQKRFRDAINIQFDKLNVEDRDRNLLKFRNKVTDLRSSSRGQNKVYAERDKYASKLKHIETDLIILKNNIGFFANSKNAEALIKDVENKIINNEEQIAYLKDKIRIIDEADNNNE